MRDGEGDMKSEDRIVGIDLGTTNSEIALVIDGRPVVIAFEGETIMPSVVGLSPDGQVLVGTAARNQALAYPGRTIKSVKRYMGSDVTLQLGERSMTPPEVSALILEELVRRARIVTGSPVRRAVITVPAFFTDAQRQGPRFAGQAAGLRVERIINEPTAAALAYEGLEGRERLLLVYDLGGGTFDASLVRADGELVEVLASHGDTRLGGDDFDELIAAHLAEVVGTAKDGKPNDAPLADAVTRARLIEAAERAKKELTESMSVRIREEFVLDGRHLDYELSRVAFEDHIAALIERSLDHVHETLAMAGKRFSDVDDILLVGGSTRVPLVGRRLAEIFGRPPRRDMHPDLCVALGAAIQAANIEGRASQRVLIDVTPYSFGPSYIGTRNGIEDPHCYHPVIERGTPLPTRRSDSYYTVYDEQDTVEFRLYQGESPNALDNIEIGEFKVSGLSKVRAGNEIVCEMQLDLNGQLIVTAVERSTGLKKTVTIEGATKDYDPAAVAASRAKNRELRRAAWDGDDDDIDEIDNFDDVVDVGDVDRGAAASAADSAATASQDVFARLRALCASVRNAALDDAARSDANELCEEADDAIARHDEKAAAAVADELEDLLHYASDA